MKKRNIISGIKQYRSEVDTNFHMPGHKGKAEILGELEKNLNFLTLRKHWERIICIILQAF